MVSALFFVWRLLLGSVTIPKWQNVDFFSGSRDIFPVNRDLVGVKVFFFFNVNTLSNIALASLISLLWRKTHYQFSCFSMAMSFLFYEITGLMTLISDHLSWIWRFFRQVDFFCISNWFLKNQFFFSNYLVFLCFNMNYLSGHTWPNIPCFFQMFDYPLRKFTFIANFFLILPD